MLFHIGAFHLDVDSHHQTPWHRITPRARILCVLLLLFANVLTPNGQWWTWAIYATALLGLVLLSRVTLVVLFQRMAVEFAFVGVVLLGTLFHEGGTVLWSWGPLQVTTVGLTILGSVICKTTLSLLILNILILTTSIPALFHALIALRTPPLLVAILASMYRYIGVLMDEFTAMRRAAASRNLTAGHGRFRRLVIGNMIGSLFIRTYDRGERIHQAMLARGYNGLPPTQDVPEERLYDIMALSLTLGIALLGQGVYLLMLPVLGGLYAP